MNRRKTCRFANVEIVLDSLRQVYPLLIWKLLLWKTWQQLTSLYFGLSMMLLLLAMEQHPSIYSSCLHAEPLQLLRSYLITIIRMPLINLHISAGIRWYGFYDNLTEHAIRFERNTYTIKDRLFWRSKDFHTSNNIVYDLVNQAVSEGFNDAWIHSKWWQWFGSVVSH